MPLATIFAAYLRFGEFLHSARHDAHPTAFTRCRMLKTAALNETRRAEYCRRKGMFVEQIAAWRLDCQQPDARSVERGREHATQSKSNRLRIKHLEKELHRKEKALTEAAALLLLRKKLQAIWGDQADD